MKPQLSSWVVVATLVAFTATARAGISFSLCRSKGGRAACASAGKPARCEQGDDALGRILNIKGDCTCCVPKEQCKDDNFHAFFSHYSDNAEFSTERTIWPLVVSDLSRDDSGGAEYPPDPGKVNRLKKGRNAFFQKFWKTDSTITQFLEKKPDIWAIPDQAIGDRQFVRFSKGGENDLFGFDFKKEKGCWKLAGVVRYTR